MCKPKSIQVPTIFFVDITQLDEKQMQQYLMISSYNTEIANRYAYFVSHPDYLLSSQINKLKQSLKMA
jgi:hypothetical protein